MNVALVLGGGGARGFAHIGVLRALEEHGFQISAIAGCSMGAIIGALHASGKGHNDIYDLMDKVSIRHVMHFGERGGLIAGKGLKRLLEQNVAATFKNLTIPFLATAVDIQSGELVILDRGELPLALRASSALPGLLSPVEIEGQLLVDGGLLNALPVDLIRTMTDDPVIAIDVAPRANRSINFETQNRFFHSISDFFDVGIGGLVNHLTVLQLFMKASTIPQAHITKMRLETYPPDLLIQPEFVENFGGEDYGNLDEAVDIGYQAATNAINELKERLFVT